MTLDRRLDFVIGEEKSLRQLLDSSEALLLLNGALGAGASAVFLRDGAGNLLASCGTEAGQLFNRKITVEGEPVGILDLWGDKSETHMNGVIEMLHCSIQNVIRSNMKRLLTSEAHTTVVNLSYHELLEANRQLAASEQRYRELAESLEIKVQERTRELQQTQAAMLQREKMVSIGHLAAGMAHEINNPIGFILSNLKSLERYNQRMLEMLELYQKAVDSALDGTGIKKQIDEQRTRLKLDFIARDCPELLSQSVAGAERISRIVADLKGFSHIDETPADELDVNQELQLTLAVMKPQLPRGAELLVELEPDLPVACGSAPQINQVFLAVIQNSLDLKLENLRLTVRTRRSGEMVEISIIDNGPGIAPEVQPRVFDPFFTTKDVGAGIGLGLTLAQQTVTACGGEIRLASSPGAGTEVIIRLPLREAIS